MLYRVEIGMIVTFDISRGEVKCDWVTLFARGVDSDELRIPGDGYYYL